MILIALGANLPSPAGPPQATLDAALKNLASYDWLILTSVNGVEAMWNRLRKLSKSPAPRDQLARE